MRIAPLRPCAAPEPAGVPLCGARSGAAMRAAAAVAAAGIGSPQATCTAALGESQRVGGSLQLHRQLLLDALLLRIVGRAIHLSHLAPQ